MSNKLSGRSCGCGNNIIYQQLQNKKIKILLEPGHGGEDTGEKIDDDYEKDKNLELAFMVGDILSKNGYDVLYTRVNDVYLSDNEKKEMANTSGADLYVALHRTSNISHMAAPGVEAIIYEPTDFEIAAANNMIKEIENLGYVSLGTLKVQGGASQYANYEIPQVTMLIGMPKDGKSFDYDVDAKKIAQAVAQGIMDSFKVIAQNYKADAHFKVQVGLFQTYDDAVNIQLRLAMNGFPTDVVKMGNRYTIHCGDFDDLNKAVYLEQMLKNEKYNTLLISK